MQKRTQAIRQRIAHKTDAAGIYHSGAGADIKAKPLEPDVQRDLPRPAASSKELRPPGSRAGIWLEGQDADLLRQQIVDQGSTPAAPQQRQRRAGLPPIPAKPLPPPPAPQAPQAAATGTSVPPPPQRQPPPLPAAPPPASKADATLPFFPDPAKVLKHAASRLDNIKELFRNAWFNVRHSRTVQTIRDLPANLAEAVKVWLTPLPSGPDIKGILRNLRKEPAPQDKAPTAAPPPQRTDSQMIGLFMLDHDLGFNDQKTLQDPQFVVQLSHQMKAASLQRVEQADDEQQKVFFDPYFQAVFRTEPSVEQRKKIAEVTVQAFRDSKGLTTPDKNDFMPYMTLAKKMFDHIKFEPPMIPTFMAIDPQKLKSEPAYRAELIQILKEGFAELDAESRTAVLDVIKTLFIAQATDWYDAASATAKDNRFTTMAIIAQPFVFALAGLSLEAWRNSQEPLTLLQNTPIANARVAAVLQLLTEAYGQIIGFDPEMKSAIEAINRVNGYPLPPELT